MRSPEKTNIQSKPKRTYKRGQIYSDLTSFNHVVIALNTLNAVSLSTPYPLTWCKRGQLSVCGADTLPAAVNLLRNWWRGFQQSSHFRFGLCRVWFFSVQPVWREISPFSSYSSQTS